jgi:uncharacterized membrane protein HdeD (DUF308 family)
MSDPITQPPFVHAFHVGLHGLRRYWGWFLAIGIIMLVLGSAAIIYTLVAEIIFIVVFGWLLLFDGIFQGVIAVWTRDWSGFFIHLLASLLSIIAGLLMVTRPNLAITLFTLVLAMYFLVGGMFRIVAPLAMKFPSWGWSLVVGLTDLFLGAFIWAEWPSDAQWVVGVFIGIGLIFRGWSNVMFGLAVKQLPASS